MATNLFEMPAVQLQTALAFPEPLTERYCPKTFADFIGLERPKTVMAKLAAKPFPSNFYFVGKSGTGKTRLALTLAALMPAELHHIASKECTLQTVQEITKQCHYMPRMANDWTPCKMHVVLADEADQMSYPAQLAFLSILDGTSRPPNTIFIFTGNDTANLETRFMSRCTVLEFSSYGIAKDAADLLARVWDAETDNPVERPDFARIVKDSANNIREALNKLQVEIMMA